MNTLTDRYLAATLRSVPSQRRDEIANELRASIEDMIDDRTGGGADPIVAEREVLTELGNPDVLAVRYADRRLQLIGPTYYLVWLRLLKLLLSFIPALVATIVTVVGVASGEGFGAIGPGIVVALHVGVHIAFWLTLIFAIIERSQPTVDLPAWTVDQLPDVPANRDISLADTVASVVMLVVAIGYLPFQYYRSWVRGADGENIPILDPALWSFWLPALIVVLAARVVFEIVKYRIGRWNWALFGAKALLDLAFSVPLAWLALSDRLLNPVLADRLSWLADVDNRNIVGAVIAVGAAAVVVWDLIDTALKTRGQAA
ncbi:permease prefix domain 1-containing protein [Micromonospora sp. NBC_00362]|uniref:permease prefix domain 1-containing protein n=1 Tax=Micromonospora sp. NBC_00362 TaxID=2975975 RepID=UPI00224EA8E6|nr:permease prefix domain 1-containing protein [Micromonospora sp. NBC_00362]MCX5121766.1 permease prefix domain 1-containing protein [Micromonospora sp. NBC_00362]